MKILVAYASRHGATRGIAYRIAETLRRPGLEVDCRTVDEVALVEEYDAFVLGSAAYMGGWLREAGQFVRHYVTTLAEHPVWLFSSGPIGTDKVDAKGRDVVEASIPREFAEFRDVVHPHDERVFFGAYDPDAEPANFAERLGSVFTRMPAIRAAMPSGDFRDWQAIDAWAETIARELVGAPVAVPA